MMSPYFIRIKEHVILIHVAFVEINNCIIDENTLWKLLPNEIKYYKAMIEKSVNSGNAGTVYDYSKLNEKWFYIILNLS